MKSIIVLDHSTHLRGVLELFKGQTELTAKKVKKKIASTSYYDHLLPKILKLNEAVRQLGIEYFIRPTFLSDGIHVLSGLEINPALRVQCSGSFIVITQEAEA